jgi:hypothetical protein
MGNEVVGNDFEHVIPQDFRERPNIVPLPRQGRAAMLAVMSRFHRIPARSLTRGDARFEEADFPRPLAPRRVLTFHGHNQGGDFRVLARSIFNRLGPR